jgi:hypothetical protein
LAAHSNQRTTPLVANLPGYKTRPLNLRE